MSRIDTRQRSLATRFSETAPQVRRARVFACSARTIQPHTRIRLSHSREAAWSLSFLPLISLLAPTAYLLMSREMKFFKKLGIWAGATLALASAGYMMRDFLASEINRGGSPIEGLFFVIGAIHLLYPVFESLITTHETFFPRDRSKSSKSDGPRVSGKPPQS